MVPIKKIMVATDFSPTSYDALERAEDLAQKLGAELLIVHVDEPMTTLGTGLGPLGSMDPTTEVTMVIERERRAQSQKFLDNLARELRERGIKARTTLLSGSAYLQILDAASSNHVDLIVVGTHGRGGLSRLLIGSVAERVVRHATCPVLTIRPRAPQADPPGTDQDASQHGGAMG